MDAIRNGSSQSGLKMRTSTYQISVGAVLRIDGHRLPNLSRTVSTYPLAHGHADRVGLYVKVIVRSRLTPNLKSFV